MLENLQEDLNKAISHLQGEFSKLQLGRANPTVIEGVFVVAYGSSQPLKNIASVTNLDAQTLSIQPWDKSLLHDIEKGISEAKLGLNPTKNGETLMIKFPPMTEERRRDTVKIASRQTEDAKVSIRNVRGDYKKKIDSAKSEKTISEDEAKMHETNLQKAIDNAIKEVEALFAEKEKDIMKI